MEQLNIEGKRSGEGFVCHREMLVSALAKAQATLAEVVGFVLGRKGFLNYLRLLGGSNIVKFLTQFHGLDLPPLVALCGLQAACQVELQP